MKQEISQKEFDQKFNQIFVDYFKSIENNPAKLHNTAANLNWGNSMEDFWEITNNPNTDVGTAVMLFWLGQPLDYWVPYNSAEDAKYYKDTYSLLDKLYNNIVSDFYATGNVAYDPKNDFGTDWTQDYKEDTSNKKLNPKVLQATEGKAIEENEEYIEGFPQSVWDQVNALENQYEIV